MEYRYTHFIPQNTAPKGAKKIGVYNASGKRVLGISLGTLTPVNKTKLYSFGLVSDCHTYYVNPSWNSNTKLDNALSYLESIGCVMCIGCGDFTQTGFYLQNETSSEITLEDGRVIGAGEVYYDNRQMSNYSSILSNHSIPVFETFGNHENYNGKDITLHLAEAKTYTGIPATAYTVSSNPATDEVVGTTARPNRQMTQVGDDLFIFVGQSTSGQPMSENDYRWLETILANNTNKRCFVFVHSYIEGDSGDADDRRENSIFQGWAYRTAFMNLLNRHSNAILFHGHSHIKLKYQIRADYANYTDKNGFKSLHIPSLGMPRDIAPDNSSNDDTPEDFSASEGYIVDVYDDCIVLNGWDFINNKPILLGTYKIAT